MKGAYGDQVVAAGYVDSLKVPRWREETVVRCGGEGTEYRPVSRVLWIP